MVNRNLSIPYHMYQGVVLINHPCRFIALAEKYTIFICHPSTKCIIAEAVPTSRDGRDLSHGAGWSTHHMILFFWWHWVLSLPFPVLQQLTTLTRKWDGGFPSPIASHSSVPIYAAVADLDNVKPMDTGMEECWPANPLLGSCACVCAQYTFLNNIYITPKSTIPISCCGNI